MTIMKLNTGFQHAAFSMQFLRFYSHRPIKIIQYETKQTETTTNNNDNSISLLILAKFGNVSNSHDGTFSIRSVSMQFANRCNIQFDLSKAAMSLNWVTVMHRYAITPSSTARLSVRRRLKLPNKMLAGVKHKK